ncbi:phycobilisome protein [Pantanalinema rosaneae CENA516]|uniref:phycobilisome protein n=1 Tax=Pantanalinema rosaneae TaxID=1620701 RepID=UPI003D6DC1CA
MLSQLQKLSVETDGRFATDAELLFVNQYARSFGLRLQTYQKLQAAEAVIVQQVYTRLQALDPTMFQVQQDDLSAKWKRDTIRVLRYSAIAMLLDDPATLQERLLFWFQSIMKAFGAQRSCHLTYATMQEVVKQYLSPVQASLFCPILEMNQKLLGTK